MGPAHPREVWPVRECVGVWATTCKRDGPPAGICYRSRVAAPRRDDADALAERLRELKPESGREGLALALGRVTAALFGDDEAPAQVKLGRYLVRGVLGEGAMGRVLDAFDPKLERGVAIKLLHGHAATESIGRARLLREARSLARLSHPNVIVVHEVAFCGPDGELEDEPPGPDARLFLVMERVDGRNLRRAVQELAAREPQAQRQVLDWYLQALDGLHAAHQAGIVHRDFKPDNILVGFDGRVRVVDFGLARGVMEAGDVHRGHAHARRDPARVPPGERGEPSDAEISSSRDSTLAEGERAAERGKEHDEADADASERRGRDISEDLTVDVLTRSGALVGTPRYMAPEQLKGDIANALSDQFSLCVALFESYFGETPFPARSIPSLLLTIAEGLPLTDPRAPDPLFAVLRRGMAYQATERYRDLKELREALRGCMVGASSDAALMSGHAESSDASTLRSGERAGSTGGAGSASVNDAAPRPAPGYANLLAGLGGALALVAAVLLIGYATGLVGLGSSDQASLNRANAAVEAPGAERAGAVDASPTDLTAAEQGAGAGLSDATREGMGDDVPGSGERLRAEQAVAGTGGADDNAPTSSGSASGETAAGIDSASESGKSTDSAKDPLGNSPRTSITACFLHEDSFALLSRGRARSSLRVDGTCHLCRQEKRKARIDRFSTAGCDAYYLCGAAADDACKP